MEGVDYSEEATNVTTIVPDKEKFSMIHLKAVLIAGIGFFSDAYDLFIINIAVPIISFAYFDGNMPILDQSLIKGAAVFGSFVGQIIFGILGDKFGRKNVFVISIGLMLIGSLASAMASSTVRGINITGMLVIWRFILGIGIGGDYPLSAVITSEFATVNTRGRMIGAVFSMQGLGQLVAGLVGVITVYAFKNMIIEDPLNTDYVWRICLGVGCIPAVIGAYFRSKMPETPQYASLKEKKEKPVEGADKPDSVDNETAVTEPKVSAWTAFKTHYSVTRNLAVLIGCAGSWFLLDIAFYGLGLNQSLVLTSIGYTAPSTHVYNYLFTLAVGNLLINLLGSVPGYYFTVALVEKMGRVKIQLMGFAMLTILFTILAAAYKPLTSSVLVLFIVLYCLAQFFFNFGPNSTTFIIPGEVFPTHIRTTSHGLSAASGKAGAILSSYGFTLLAHNWGVQGLLGLFAGVMFLGFLCTFLVPDTTGISLEEVDKGNLKFIWSKKPNQAEPTTNA